MPSLSKSEIPSLAAALMNLKGESLGSIAVGTGIRKENLSVWLRGREQVISDARVMLLLHHLGVKGGQLRTDIVHEWTARGSIDHVKLILNSLFDENQKTTFLIFSDYYADFATTYLLEFHNKSDIGWIILKLEPSAESDPKLSPSTIGFGKELKTNLDLKDLPNSLNQLKSAIPHIHRDVLAILDLNKKYIEDSVKNMLSDVESVVPDSIRPPSLFERGIVPLEMELVRILQMGVSPEEIADKLATIYL